MDYWVKIILWEFWSWKTYNVYYEAYLRKLSKENPYIIANVPYYFVDLCYSSVDDLIKIFKVLVDYSDITNKKEILQDYDWFRPIIFILDEAHLYFFSRWFSKNFNKEQLIVLSQVRKRKISMYLITQELAQLDSTFRRLVPAVRKYYYWFGFWRWYVDYYLKKDDTDIKNEEISDKVGWWPVFGSYLAPKIKYFFLKILNSKKLAFFRDYWTSYYITWFEKKINVLTLNSFLNDLYKNDENKKNEIIKFGWYQEEKEGTMIYSGTNGKVS